MKEPNKEILSANGYVKGTLPVKYLGVPFDSKKLTVEACMHVIEQIVNRNEALVL